MRHLPFLLLLALAGTASAHPAVVAHVHDGFLAGLLHPLTGGDHLAAMLAVGVWSALAVRPVWLAPAAFVTMLVAGACAAFAVPAVEQMVAASLLVTGLLVATRRGLPAVVAALLVGGFAFFHGAAHGVELGGGAALVGMVLATIALHATGIVIGRRLLARAAWLPRVTGSGVALFGAALLLRLVVA